MDNIEDTMFNFKVTNLYSGITSDHFFENEPDNEQITKSVYISDHSISTEKMIIDCLEYMTQHTGIVKLVSNDTLVVERV